VLLPPGPPSASRPPRPAPSSRPGARGHGHRTYPLPVVSPCGCCRDSSEQRAIGIACIEKEISTRPGHVGTCTPHLPSTRRYPTRARRSQSQRDRSTTERRAAIHKAQFRGSGRQSALSIGETERSYRPLLLQAPPTLDSDAAAPAHPPSPSCARAAAAPFPDAPRPSQRFFLVSALGFAGGATDTVSFFTCSCAAWSRGPSPSP